METNQSLNLFERFNRWIQESIMVKLFSIAFLILILLIPAVWIQDLISERQQRADMVIDEVSDKWSGSQTLCGPILVIPYKRFEVVDVGKGEKQTREYTEKAFFLPHELNVTGKLDPQVLHRGIFDAVVYESAIGIHSVFARPDFKTLKIDERNVLWSDAYLAFGITDLRGISDKLDLASGSQPLSAEPASNIGVAVTKNPRFGYNGYGEYRNESESLSQNGILARLPWTGPESFTGEVKLNLKLKGSRQLDFVPTGRTTTVRVEGDWKDPSFDGEFLPSSREIAENGFTATWKVLHYNRPFSQQWTGENRELTGADFGVKLLMPVDQYQKSTRTAKYGVLIILLTFMALFLVEITEKIRIHPFQYILIGAALIIYYTLLLSLSEHTGFNLAYIIASAATVVLVGAYSTTFLTHGRVAVLFSVLLVIFYSFIYVIILEQDYSLLLGSIGLFLIIGTVMYFSRKVKWYKEPVREL